MSFLWWQRGGDARIASDRRVLRAAEVPLLQHALALRDTLERRRDEQVQAITEAIAAGRAEGHAAGLAEGRAAAALELAETVQRLAAESDAERERLRQDIAALALQVVRKLLGAFARDEVLLALAANAAAELLPGAAPVLVVHPQQAGALRTRMDAVAHEGEAPFDVREDAQAAIESCRLETEHGCVDVSLDAQLSRLAEAWGVGPRPGVPGPGRAMTSAGTRSAVASAEGLP
jgi:flagellar biosynthesis/type III secretory pathway protein FliH